MSLGFGFYNMDCMDGMKQFKDKYFDIAIVDPPYGIGVGSMAYTQNRQRIYGQSKARPRDYSGHESWDKERPSAEYFEELFRVSKRQIIWGGAITLLICSRRRGGLSAGINEYITI